MDDIQNLPYVMAAVMEIQRMANVAPGSLPHYLMKDIAFNNYTFKKGTLFIANLSKFLMDPDVFPLPKHFNPDRFRDENGKLIRIEQFAPFSIGKRICMGESLAKNELFIFFVRLVQRLNIGVWFSEIPDPEQYVSGITRIPKPYKVVISARG